MTWKLAAYAAVFALLAGAAVMITVLGFCGGALLRALAR